MKKYFFIITILVSFLLHPQFLSRISASVTEEKVDELISNRSFDANTILVKYKNSEEISAINITLNKKPKEAINRTERELVRSKLLEALNNEDVEFAQPNYLYNPAAWVSKLGYTVPSTFDENKHWYYLKSGVPDAWRYQNCPNEEFCGGNPEVVVAVIDSGLAFEEFDDSDGLTGAKYAASPAYRGINLFQNEEEIPENGLDDDCNGIVDDYNGADTFAVILVGMETCDDETPIEVDEEFIKAGHPVDTYGHGTYVTGLIASDVNNPAVDTISPAFNISIMPIAANIHFDEFFTTQSVINGVAYAIEQEADIINMSLTTTYRDWLLEQVVTEAHEEGILVVSAAGNTASDELSFPAAFDTVLSVGAVNSDDKKSNYSNFGSTVDAVAYVGDGTLTSGNAVHQSTLACFGFCDEENISGGFKNYNLIGTSFAAPQVSALAALIKSNNPEATPDQLKNMITSTATDIGAVGRDNQTGFGVISFKDALDPSGMDVEGLDIVFRFYSPILRAHFYTIDENEKDYLIDNSSSVWTFEGEAFRAFKKNLELDPVYRFWSDEYKTHFYTIDSAEKIYVANELGSIWKYEGVAFYSYKDNLNLSPVYRFWSNNNRRHFYTTDPTERDYIQDSYSEDEWKYEGIAFYAFT